MAITTVAGSKKSSSPIVENDRSRKPQYLEGRCTDVVVNFDQFSIEVVLMSANAAKLRTAGAN